MVAQTATIRSAAGSAAISRFRHFDTLETADSLKEQFGESIFIVPLEFFQF
jgi:hypothetical protein